MPHTHPYKTPQESKQQSKYDKNIEEILTEADKITIDDLEFDNIIKEQPQMICNINKMLNIKKGKTDTTKCNIKNIKNDKELKLLIKDFDKNYKKFGTKSLKHITKSEKKKKTKSKSQ